MQLPDNPQLETWRAVWRKGVTPNLTMKQLEALEKALETNDMLLLQGQTTTPPPLMCVSEWPCEAGCAFAYMIWKGGDKHGKVCQTVGQVEEGFAELCFDTDRSIGEPAACRWFLNWFDDSNRNDMLRELLGEVKRSISEKNSEKKTTTTQEQA